MVPAPVQAAMIAALGDEVHVAEQRDRYRARRDVLLPALEAAGYRVEGSEAGLYLWATRGADAWDAVAEFAELGIVVGPGHFYGSHSPKHVRLALTARDEAITEAAQRIREASAA
jgi:aspartate/methionine/tyrosine aminotransferase